MNTETRENNPDPPTIDGKSVDDWKWLNEAKTTREWKLIRAGLAHILTDDLADFVGRGIHVTQYTEDNVPMAFALNEDIVEIRISAEDTNLDWLALHLDGTWRRMTDRWW